MSKGNTFENDWMKIVFNATPITNLADNSSSSALTNLYVSLHTTDPGEAGSQITNETTYTGYARVAVARTSTAWTITNNSVSPVANIDFPIGSGGTALVEYFSIGTLSGTSAGKLLYSGTITPTIQTGNGVTPRLTTASAITED